MKKIAIFNHKGGVAKTTTTFNLGSAIARQGKKVLLVDTDSQCNLTLYSMGYENMRITVNQEIRIISMDV